MKVFKVISLILLILVVITGSVFGVIYFNVEPELTIKGEKEIILDLNAEYKEDGYEAYILNQNVSKDVKVTNDINNTKVGTYTINYYISNKFIKKDNYTTRTVKIVDNIKPEIKLTGENVSIYEGSKYTEPGYSASDNYDGEITNNVVVTNNIDTSKAGNYEVIYSISDSSGNKFETKRSVEVKKKPVVKTTPSNNRTGYGIPVLMYHYFYDASKGEVGKDSNWMEISAFENQLKYLDENDYYFPTWSELNDFIDGKIILPKKSVIITIDDGHASLFNLAIPVINKYDVKVTSFVITSKTSASKIDQYKSDKVIFQTHTHNMHRGGCTGGHGGLFRCIAYDKGLDDLKQSIAITGSSDVMAYPYGDVTDNVLKITKASGIKLAFTTKYGKVYKGMDKLQLPRVRMSRGVSLKGFINSIS